MPYRLALALLLAPCLPHQQILNVPNPTQKDPLMERIQAFKAAKDWAGLADWLETLTPKQRGVYLMDCELALSRAGRWERLGEVCFAVLAQTEAKNGPRPSMERTYRAMALFQQGMFPEAMEASALNAKLTGYASDFVAACWSAERMKDWKALEVQADAFLARHPAKGDALAYRGEALTRQERYAEAEPVLRKALETDHSLVFAWTNLSCCLNETHRYQEAKDAADHALGRDPGYLEALSNRACAFLGLKMYREARVDYAALVDSPDTAPAIFANAKLNLTRIAAFLATGTKKAKRK